MFDDLARQLVHACLFLGGAWLFGEIIKAFETKESSHDRWERMKKEQKEFK